MAANAQVAGGRGILLGDGEARVEQRVARRLSHHRATEIAARLHGRRIAAVARVARVVALERAGPERLRAGLEEVAERRRELAAGRADDRERGVALVCSNIAGSVVREDADAGGGRGRVVDEPREAAGVRLAER